MQTLYKFLTDNNYHWDRTSPNEIWVALNGYWRQDSRRVALDKAIREVGAVCVKEDWDQYSQKTFYRFKHK